MTTLATTASLAMMAALATAAAAQDTATVHIGSPYVNFDQKQGLEAYVGYFAGNTGAAHVGPQGSFMIGADYFMHLGGPVFAQGRLTYAASQRTVMDPITVQSIGVVSSPLYMFDLGIYASITGEKTWHKILPLAGFALGVAYDPQKPDVGGYSFGTKAYFGIGGGIAYRISGHWVGRVDLWDYLWQLKYPTSYINASNTGILPTSAAYKEWTNNGIFSVGVSYILR
jgi:hypothetical protein